MDRETALRQLQDIRQVILEIHTEMETCQRLQKRVEALQNEKEHPAPPTVSLKPENTADKLKRTFEQQNRQRCAANRKPERLVKLVNVVWQLLICAVLAMDLFGHKGIIIHSDRMAEIEQFGNENRVMLFAAQALLSLVALLAPLFPTFFRGRGAVLIAVSGLLLIGYLYMMGSMVHAWLYVILFVASIALMAAAFGIIALVRKGRMKSPSLTGEQKRQWQAACRADEKAKAQNVQLREQAKKNREEERARRLPEIDREIGESVQEFNESRRRIDGHMEKLAAMDALCEEDKTLQIVDLLIRFIQTRRADSIKEALQEYDKLMANRRLLEMEKQKLAAELQRASQEHADRMQQLEAEKRHQSEMEYLAWDSAQSRKQIVSQLNNIGDIIYYDLHG